jgi:hypothetical protein
MRIVWWKITKGRKSRDTVSSRLTKIFI